MSLATRAGRGGAVAWLLLGAAVVATAGIAYVLVLSQYFVMPDELTYQRQSFAMANAGHPLGPGSYEYTSISQLPQVLRAPLFMAFTVTAASDLAHVLNVVLFVSAIVPTYMLAQRVTGSPPASALAATATVAVPWLAMSGSMMTEPVAYPAFAWALLGMQRAVAAPSVQSDVVGLAAIALAVATRPQFVVLVPALVVAVIVRELACAFRGPSIPGRLAVRQALRRHAPLCAVVVAAVILLVVLGADRVRSDSLGYYDTAATGNLLPRGTGSAATQLLGDVTLACGAIPLVLAVAWALAALTRLDHAEHHAFAILFVLVGASVLLVGASFTARFTTGLNDRYVEYLAPMLFVGAAAALATGPLRAVPLVVAGAGTTVVIASTHLAPAGLSLISPGAAFQPVLHGRVQQAGRLVGLGDVSVSRTLAAIVAAIVLALVAAGARRSSGVVGAIVAVPVLGFLVAETAYTLDKLADTQRGASEAFLDQRSWIDRALGRDATAQALLATVGDPVTTTTTWWSALFWNRSLRGPYALRGVSTFEQSFPHTVTVDDMTGELLGLPGGYVVVPAKASTFALRGAEVLRREQGLSLVRVPATPSIAWSLLTRDGTTTVPVGSSARLRIYGGDPERRRRLSMVVAAEGTPLRVQVTQDAGKRLADQSLRVGRSTRLVLHPRIAADGRASMTVRASAPTADSPSRPAALKVVEVTLAT